MVSALYLLPGSCTRKPAFHCTANLAKLSTTHFPVTSYAKSDFIHIDELFLSEFITSICPRRIALTNDTFDRSMHDVRGSMVVSVSRTVGSIVDLGLVIGGL